MNVFDASIIELFNEYSQESWFFDRIVKLVSGNTLLKGGVLMTVLWGFWFGSANSRQTRRYREYIISTLVSSLVALCVARALALMLPFRFRPIHDPELLFRVPHGSMSTALESWSSFPSDHAVMFFALATGVCFLSRRLGIAALLYVFTVICLPRVYLGLHYPTDILAGALIGASISYLMNSCLIRKRIALPAMQWLHKAPATFYGLLFMMTYQIANMFVQVRTIVSASFVAFRHLMT